MLWLGSVASTPSLSLIVTSRRGYYTLSRKGIPMTLPKDPQKREEYLRNQSEKAKARLADPEIRKAMSEKGKARFADPEVRKAASEKGKEQFTNNPEARARMSEIVKKRLEDPEYKQNLDAKRAEAMRRPEVRAKLSAATTSTMSDPARREQLREQAVLQWSDPELRQRQSEKTGKRMRGEGGKRHSAIMKERFARPEAEPLKQQARESLEAIRQRPGYWDEVREQLAGLRDDPEVQQKRVQAIQQAYTDPEHKANLKAAMDEVRQRPGYWEAVARGQAASKKYSQTDIEQIIEDLLQAWGIEYEPQKPLGRWRVDFYVSAKNLVIECDGDYWHSIPEVQERDTRKNDYLTQQGYNILRLLGSQIYAGDLDVLIQALA